MCTGTKMEIEMTNNGDIIPRNNFSYKFWDRYLEKKRKKSVQ